MSHAPTHTHPSDLRRTLARVVSEQDEAVAIDTIPRTSDDDARPMRNRGPVGAEPDAAVDEELWLAHVCYARTRDAELRRLLTEEYQGYIVSLARRFHRDAEPLEDLVQVAFEGLLVSLNRFDPSRGVPFIGFATPTIVGALKRHYRDVGWLLRVPRRVHELASPARRTSEELTVELGRPPSLEETAERMGVDVEDLLMAQEAANARSVRSIDALTQVDGHHRDHLGSDDPAIGKVDDLLALREAMAELTDRDREVIRLYFFEEWSQVQIAEQFGVSQMQVSRWISASLRRLRSWLPAS